MLVSSWGWARAKLLVRWCVLLLNKQKERRLASVSNHTHNVTYRSLKALTLLDVRVTCLPCGPLKTFGQRYKELGNFSQYTLCFTQEKYFENRSYRLVFQWAPQQPSCDMKLYKSPAALIERHDFYSTFVIFTFDHLGFFRSWSPPCTSAFWVWSFPPTLSTWRRKMLSMRRARQASPATPMPCGGAW